MGMMQRGDANGSEKGCDGLKAQRSMNEGEIVVRLSYAPYNGNCVYTFRCPEQLGVCTEIET